MADEQSIDRDFKCEDDKSTETSDKNGNDDVLDLSGQSIRKLEKNTYGNFRFLNLDRNELSKLENIESYGNIRKLSLRENKFMRMYCVCRLIHLRELDLSNNSIVVIEGMRELIHLNVLRLADNKIKTIEHISTNIALEILDLSNNCISSLSDLSHLKMLHTLLLNNNTIKHVNNASALLPLSISSVNLAGNLICDLNQVSNLTELCNLEEFWITNNPCVDLNKSPVAFDYRPFIISWCQSLKSLDSYAVSSKESLKSEWLYSMGKGRHFHIGDHADLIDYLSNVCPLTTLENLTSEEDVKLNRILKQRRQHQKQLLVEMSEEKSNCRSSTLPILGTKSPTLTDSAGLMERSKSALPVRTHYKSSSVATCSPLSPFQLSASTSKQVEFAPKADINDGNMDTVDNSREHQNGSYESDMSFYKGEIPSDVPESSYVYNPVEPPASTKPLKSDTQYVPVPETMLSPDFRPISNSFHAGMYDGQFNADVETEKQEFPQSWSSWSQPTQTSIPRNISLPKPTHRNSSRVSSDWPVARRPTQIQRVQKATRPLSLSPSNYRRSPATRHKTSPRPSTTPRPRVKSANVEDSSSDSDMSMSKLVLVKEAVARKTKDVTEESKRGQPHFENPKNRVETNGHAPHKSKTNVKKETTKVEYCEIYDEHETGVRNKAATKIQAFWRSYYARQKHPVSTATRLEIRLRRAEDHVLELQRQLAITQEELASEKRFRSMQMEAIKSIWVQVQQLHSNNL